MTCVHRRSAITVRHKEKGNEAPKRPKASTEDFGFCADYVKPLLLLTASAKMRKHRVAEAPGRS